MSPRYDEIPVLFKTLREAGYTRCTHYRMDEEGCMDCGAQKAPFGWVGGHLEFKRKPHKVPVK